jgi:hypothetical protein
MKPRTPPAKEQIEETPSGQPKNGIVRHKNPPATRFHCFSGEGFPLIYDKRMVISTNLPVRRGPGLSERSRRYSITPRHAGTELNKYTLKTVTYTD